LFSRLDNPVRNAIVIAHACVHEDDITGVLLDPECDAVPDRPDIEKAESAAAAMLDQGVEMRPLPLSPYWCCRVFVCGGTHKRAARRTSYCAR